MLPFEGNRQSRIQAVKQAMRRPIKECKFCGTGSLGTGTALKLSHTAHRPTRRLPPRSDSFACEDV